MKKFANLSDFLRAFPVISRVPVKWGDMDAFAHVNNTVYFKYQEVARLKFFDTLMENMDRSKFDVEGFQRATKIGPILSETYCKFKYPLKYPDKVLVGATILPGDMARDRYKLSHAVWSLKDNKVASEGFGTVVNFDYEHGKVVPICENMSKALEKVLSHNSIGLLESLKYSEKDLTDH